MQVRDWKRWGIAQGAQGAESFMLCIYIYIDLVCLVCYGLFQFVSNAMYKNRGRGEIPACVCSKCRMHNA